MADEFKKFYHKRKPVGGFWIRPYVPGEDETKLIMSATDNPQVGDMVFKIEKTDQRKYLMKASNFAGWEPAEEPDYKMILINFVHSLTLSDNQGDTMEDAVQALTQAGIELPKSLEDDDQIRDYLTTQFGATGLWGEMGQDT